MIGSAAGYCEKHKMDKMFVGLEDATEPTCVKCVADSKPKLGRTQVVEDPGEEYFTGKNAASVAKITLLDNVPTSASDGAAGIAKIPVRPASLRVIVETAVAQLNNLPMPKDIKEFKRVQKVIKTLQSLVENQNG